MNDLTEFLLTRVDEAEVALDNCQDWSECDPSYGCPAHPLSGQRRAELDVIRQIAEHWQQAAWPATYAALTEEDARYDRGLADGLVLAMQHLALPYSAHADYMEEWKP